MPLEFATLAGLGSPLGTGVPSIGLFWVLAAGLAGGSG